MDELNTRTDTEIYTDKWFYIPLIIFFSTRYFGSDLYTFQSFYTYIFFLMYMVRLASPNITNIHTQYLTPIFQRQNRIPFIFSSWKSRLLMARTGIFNQIFEIHGSFSLHVKPSQHMECLLMSIHWSLNYYYVIQ